MKRLLIAFLLFACITTNAQGNYVYVQMPVSQGKFDSTIKQLRDSIGIMRDSMALMSLKRVMLFNQVGTRTVTSPITNVSFFGSGVGSRVIPANMLKVGSIIRISGRGVYSTPVLALLSNLKVTVKITGTTAAENTTATLLASAVNADFSSDIDLVVQSIGTAGSVISDGNMNFKLGGDGSRSFLPLNNALATSTINTTIPNTIDLQLTWPVTGHSAVLREAMIEIINP